MKKAILHAEPHTCPTFSTAEYEIIGEFLRIAQQALLDGAVTLDKLHPTSPLAERLRVDAETAADLRERIESR